MRSTLHSTNLPLLPSKRSSSTPDIRSTASGWQQWKVDGASQLSTLNALEGSLGAKGERLANAMRAGNAKEKVRQAVASGSLSKLRSALRYAAHVRGGSLPDDPDIQFAWAQLRKAEKCVIACREGLVSGNIMALHDALEQAEGLQLGEKLWADPCLSEARQHVQEWSHSEQFLRRLTRAYRRGPVDYCVCWMEVVEGELLREPYTSVADAQLLRMRDRDGMIERALASALALPELRLIYEVPWERRLELVPAVKFRISNLGFNVADLHFCHARAYGCGDAATAIVIKGDARVLQELSEHLASLADGEPRVLHGLSPAYETPEQRAARVASLVERLSQATAEPPHLIDHARTIEQGHAEGVAEGASASATQFPPSKGSRSRASMR